MTVATTASRPDTSASRALRRPRLRSWAPVGVLLLLCVAISIVNPHFLSFGNAVRIGQAAMIPLVLGMGATFIILMGSIDLSVEGVVTLAAVILSALVLNGANANDFGLAAALLVLALGAAFGFINGVIHVLLRVPSFMATLGTWFVGVGAANAFLGGMSIRINDPLVRGLAIEHFLGFPWGVWVALACLGIALLIQNHTRFGRHVYALGRGGTGGLVGHVAPRVRIAAFTLAGVFYAVGGILAAAQLGIGNALIGNGRLFTTVTAVVVGGTALSGGHGGVLQTLVGVLIVVILANGMVLMGVPPSVQIGVQGLIIIVAVALSIDRKRLRIVK